MNPKLFVQVENTYVNTEEMFIAIYKIVVNWKFN